MRHRKAFNHLKRKSSHRKSMLSNMSCSLIIHKRIKTTLAKAKALKRVVEPIINRSKNDTTHNRRMVFRNLRQKDAVTELFSIDGEQRYYLKESVEREKIKVTSRYIGEKLKLQSKGSYKN